MLEKKSNNRLVSKLCIILLLKADFNAANKILFNTRMIPRIENENLIPREIIGGRTYQLAIHIVVDKKLITDIANQFKTLHVIISVDASNCFDRVTYPISTIICKHFGLPMEYILTFFSMIQDMQMHLLTACRISENYYI